MGWLRLADQPPWVSATDCPCTLSNDTRAQVVTQEAFCAANQGVTHIRVALMDLSNKIEYEHKSSHHLLQFSEHLKFVS